MVSCEWCDYDVIRGFRRIGNAPDEDGITYIRFSDPLDLSAFRKDDE